MSRDVRCRSPYVVRASFASGDTVLDVSRAEGPERSSSFNGVKVFSATMFQQRAQLGDVVTAWIAAHPAFEIADIVVTQSSDDEFHMLALSVFYRDKPQSH
jgi:hypothetical protein